MKELDPKTIDLFEFLDSSTSPYHATRNVQKRLLSAGFTLLEEETGWDGTPGGYFFVRDGSIIAWYQDESKLANKGLGIIASHTDSPNLRLKPAVRGTAAGLAQFGVEVYGGPLLNSWLDRDLGISGRLVTRNSLSGFEEILVQINEPLAKIPQLAIHLNRNVNENGLVVNPHQHLRPIWDDLVSESANFIDLIATKNEIDPQTILSWDLMLHDVQPASLIGARRQWIASARIDNLISCYTAVNGFLKAIETGNLNWIPMICLFNHEEVGSTSSAGAGSNLLPSVANRVLGFQGNNKHSDLIAKSKLISADGAHATHPNYIEKHDMDHEVRMNEGIVIKRNSNERYATSAIGQAFIQLLCESNEIPYQYFSNRSDLACGSTIGPIASANLGIQTIDIGIPQLSMHSTRELCGIEDVIHLERLMTSFFSS